MKLLNYVLSAYWALILVLFLFGNDVGDFTIALAFINSGIMFLFNGLEAK